MSQSLRVLITCTILLGASTAYADVTVFHSARGAYVAPGAPVGTAPDGFRSASTPGAGDNYLLRAVNSGFPGVGPPEETDRNYHSFDLSPYTGGVTSATLRIWADIDAYDSSAAFETIGLFDVTTAASVLDDPLSDPVAAALVFDDLGTGVPYGSEDVFPADDSSFVDIALNPAAVTAIDGLVGSGTWSVGGAMLTIDGTYGGPISERIFKNDSSTPSEPNAQLVLVGSVGLPPAVPVAGPVARMLLASGLASFGSWRVRKRS